MPGLPEKESSSTSGSPNAGLKAAHSIQNNKASPQARILLVEDEFLIATALENDLIDGGYDVIRIVSSVAAAVSVARQERPDLVMMDIRLQGPGDGVDAALQIYAETGIRCIFATAHVDIQSKARAVSASPLAWLQKPYGRETVLATVRKALEELAERG